MNHTVANQACAPSPEARSLSVHAEAHVASAEELALISLSARLLFENGQSTEKVVSALDQLANALGFRATIFPRWGELTILIKDGGSSRHEILAAVPAGGYEKVRGAFRKPARETPVEETMEIRSTREDDGEHVSAGASGD